MPRTSLAFTIPVDSSPFAGSDVHVRPTRLIRNHAERATTVVSRVAWAGLGCQSCRAHLEVEAQFCGMCGRRVRARTSRIGDVIDGLYQIASMVAEGAHATVYRARYLPTGQDLAVKVLHTTAGTNEGAAARFRREARTLSRLRSPHAVAAYDHGHTDDGAPYIAMDLLEGERLDVRLRVHGPQPWRSALSIMRDLSCALEEVHAHGIVHRDVSPRNVMLAHDLTATLLDFGLAKLTVEEGDDELSRAGRAVGALGYSAPEVLAGEACDGRADLYSLGMIVWEIVVGGFPRVRPQSLRNLPLDVQRLVRRCVEPDREQRFSTASELRREIDGLLAPRAPDEIPSLAAARRIYGHTSAFELLPPRIVIARGSEPEVAVPAVRSRWKLWAIALVAGGIGLGTAVAGCV